MSIFDTGLSWNLYKYMESDFIHFLNYVPYTHDQQTVYSPKLLALILQIGGYVDTVFKEMARFSEFQEIPECRIINQAIQTENYHIGLARSAYEKIYSISVFFLGSCSFLKTSNPT